MEDGLDREAGSRRREAARHRESQQAPGFVEDTEALPRLGGKCG